MVHLFTDSRMLDHVPMRPHPERPERLAALLRHLNRTGLIHSCPAGPVRLATDEELARVHDPGYIREIGEFAAQGGGLIEMDTWVSPGSEQAARLAAGAAIEAVSYVLGGAGRRAMCLVRPPGHHARPSEAMGFCLYDSIAVAAADAVQRHGLGRVLIVDFDVHHGNGTQEIFYNDSRVGFFSIHRFPFYPGTGDDDETGTGSGLGMTRNVPLRFGISRRDYLSAFRSSLEEMASHVRPELVLISAGFDAHAEDPIGSLGLEIEDFEQMTRDIVHIADVHAHGEVVSILEGGYNVPILTGCVMAHLAALGVETVPAPVDQDLEIG